MYSLASDEYISQLFDFYSQSMLRVAFAILKNKHDAEDAVQEAFLKYILKDPVFKDDEHEKAWFLRVTINVSKNMLRSSQRKNVPLDENIVFEDEMSSEVLNCVLMLPEHYRTIIHLYYYEGYSIKEIASILHLPSATVGTRLSRARKKLKNIMEGDFEL